MKIVTYTQYDDVVYMCPDSYIKFKNQ